ncbi:hypothetical protein ACG83_18215 [Frankia sp. R43]|uniref:DMT family transporter n=1 Tax=Frankia sp. R43 TaxID=269536 RepID=UPI0006CA0F95|nr:DMT family transporter [Frankia sp. R43]KPM53996.1 hypothetical protein ACG83_18215 [Frankia sp. R43]
MKAATRSLRAAPPPLILLVSAGFFASSILPAQWAVRDLRPAAAVAVRFVVATALVGLALAAVAWRRTAAVGAAAGAEMLAGAAAGGGTGGGTGGGQKVLTRLLVTGSVLAGGVNTVGFVLQNSALDRAEAGTVAFLSSMSVVVVPVLLALASRHWPPGRRIAGVALAVAGSFVLTGAELDLGAGEALALLSAVGGSLHVMATSHFAPLLRGPWFNLGQLGVVALLASLATAVVGVGAVTWPALLAAGYTGVAQAVGLSLQVMAQRRLDGGQAVMILTTIPVMTTVAAWLVVGDPLTAAVVGGGVLIVAGVAVSECGAPPWPPGRIASSFPASFPARLSARSPSRHPRPPNPVFPLSQPTSGPAAPAALDAPVALAGEE